MACSAATTRQLGAVSIGHRPINLNFPYLCADATTQLTLIESSPKSDRANLSFCANAKGVLSIPIGQSSTPHGTKYYHLTNYWWDIRWEKHRVTSRCFDRWDQWHLNIHLKRKSPEKEIVNIHLLWWQENGRWCFGIYESASTWCWSKCSVTWDDLKNAFSSAVKAGSNKTGLYLSWATAAALAAALMLLIFAAWDPQK